MLAVRRLRPQPIKFSRTSTTLQAAPSDALILKRRSRPLKTRRPKLSPEHEWKRPLAYGVLPAFDEALKFIKADSELLKLQIQDARTELEVATRASDLVAIKKVEQKLHYLKIQSGVNFPEVQWRCANGLGDMSKAVDRHIIERRWRTEGSLDLLMERIHQMHVVPDVVPTLHPSFDLRISFPEHRATGARTAQVYKFVEPGAYLLPEQTINPPALHKDVFHTDERLYTLIMVDPDVPDEANSSYQTFLHWLQPNIPLSATSSPLIANVNTHTKYIPPHPQKGTTYHRYTILLLPQKSRVDVPVVERHQRLGFSVRGFIAKYNLEPSTGGGAHMWRGEWDLAVPKIYQDLLETEEPVYGKPPKPSRYADARSKSRYFL